MGVVLSSLAAGCLINTESIEQDGVYRCSTDDDCSNGFICVDSTCNLDTGTPENPWYVDVRRDPAVRLSWDTGSAGFVAEPVPGAGARGRVGSP